MRAALGAIAAFSLLAVGGCAEPTPDLNSPGFVADAAQAHHDLQFLPGSAQLASGEQERLTGFLQALVLRPGDDIVLHFAPSGSMVLDRQRVAATELAVTRARTPARVRIMDVRGFGALPGSGDVVLVQARRFDRVVVDCRPRRHEAFEPGYSLPLPRAGCANAANLANMAVSVRDLTDPRSLGPSDASVSAAAVGRHRAGQVTPAKSLSGM